MAETTVAQAGHNFKTLSKETITYKGFDDPLLSDILKQLEEYGKRTVYSIVNKKNIDDTESHFKYGWGDNPLSILEYFHEQKSLPQGERHIENGDYVILFHDRDSGAFGHAIWGNDPSYKIRTYRMK